MIACLDAAYAAPPATPRIPAPEDVLTSTPALLNHLRQLVLGPDQRATQVDPENSVPLREIDLVDGGRLVFHAALLNAMSTRLKRSMSCLIAAST